jgi:hypothetical protein
LYFWLLKLVEVGMKTSSQASSNNNSTNNPPPVLPDLVAIPDAVALFIRIARMDLFAKVLGIRGYVRCWTPPLTLLGMILGHLVGLGTLERVVNEMRSGIADPLCAPLKKLSVLLQKCASTAAYAQARARLPLSWLRRCLDAQAAALRSLATGGLWKDLEVRILDGTMITMRPHGRIPKRFPPHSNQHGDCYWCQMRVLACLCLSTGIILSLVMGNAADSEQAQAVRMMLCGGGSGSAAAAVAAGSIVWMGDANFGVWRVVAASRQSRQLILVRLTVPRAKKLAGGRSLTPGLDLTVTWHPSKADKVDRGLHQVGVAGRLIVVLRERHGYRPITLLLFTTIEASVASNAELAALYARRWRIELSLRYFKTQLGLGELAAKSPAMAKRELLTGAMAYNLVRGMILLSAAAHQRPVWGLSFTKARWELLEAIASGEDPAHWAHHLRRIAWGKLPRRSKPRPSEPRQKRHRRETFPPLRGSRADARRRIGDEKK